MRRGHGTIPQSAEAREALKRQQHEWDYGKIETTCPKCTKTDFTRKGHHADGRQRLRCKACHHTFLWIVDAPKKPRYPRCPVCKGEPMAKGWSPDGGRRHFNCKRCGWNFTYPYSISPPERGFSCPHAVTFNLHRAAVENLTEFCNETGMSPVQAIRAIFRRAALEDFDGLMPEAANERLPNAVAQMSRERLSRQGPLRYEPTVGIVVSVRVAMDDLAKEGLVRTMRARGLTHQEAARKLIADASFLEK